MTDTTPAHIPVRNPEDIAHLARFVATYGRGLLRVMDETAAGTLESGSPSAPTAEDTAYAILAALPALGWFRSPGAGADGTVAHEWAARWVDEVDGPGYTPEEAREQVTWNGVPGDMGEVVRRVVWTVTTPDGWTHVSTGPWEVAP